MDFDILISSCYHYTLGGEFAFLDNNKVTTTIHPTAGRLSLFTSGSENVHRVEKVTEGTRYVLTIAFTCDKSQSIGDQFLQKITTAALSVPSTRREEPRQ